MSVSIISYWTLHELSILFSIQLKTAMSNKSLD